MKKFKRQIFDFQMVLKNFLKIYINFQAGRVRRRMYLELTQGELIASELTWKMALYDETLHEQIILSHVTGFFLLSNGQTNNRRNIKNHRNVYKSKSIGECYNEMGQMDLMWHAVRK